MHPDALKRDEVRSALERKGCRRVPLMIKMWVGGDCYDACGDSLKNFVNTIPEDFLQVGFRAPGGWESAQDYPEYRWSIKDKPDEDETAKGIDSRRFLSKWDYLDEYIEKMPSPIIPDFFTGAAQVRKDNPDAFVVGMDFFCFYERLWTIRGMQDLLADFLLEPEKVMRLTNAVRDFHLKVIKGYGTNVDAIYTSDDMGTQESLFFSPDVFRKFIKPAYAALIEEAHSHNMQFWLHTCGNVTSIMEDLIEIGLDVIHPIQPFAMDAKATVEAYGGRITFMPGIDVQHLLPHCSKDEVIAGTKEVIDTFRHPGGGMIFSLSNAIHTDVPCENIEAFMQTAYDYGIEASRK